MQISALACTQCVRTACQVFFVTAAAGLGSRWRQASPAPLVAGPGEGAVYGASRGAGAGAAKLATAQPSSTIAVRDIVLGISCSIRDQRHIQATFLRVAWRVPNRQGWSHLKCRLRLRRLEDRWRLICARGGCGKAEERKILPVTAESACSAGISGTSPRQPPPTFRVCQKPRIFSRSFTVCHHRGNAEHILCAESDEPGKCHTLMGCHRLAFVYLSTDVVGPNIHVSFYSSNISIRICSMLPEHTCRP